ncbi:MAG: hypothetical protein WB987_04285 [Candidatus Acidiferrales bacterium]
MASAIVNVPIVARQVKDKKVTARLIGLTATQILAGEAALVAQSYFLSHVH